MNTRINTHLKIIFPRKTGLLESEPYAAWVTATKEVDLIDIPKPGQWSNDGGTQMQFYDVAHSLSGPRFIVDADIGFAHGWNDMGGVPRYPYERAIQCLCGLSRAGWEIAIEQPL